ncbi:MULTISPECIES: type II toxin-antitoxin system death-on-curing family toxin [Hyphobacterium]|uniref:Type II toxin-antitoxin system death-on-curing family toxin n=1 Tax=Hyphobacterium vulgare TaxID=1736751 RepID=A0ABV6ZUG2_9PROT|nr:type II toxin-antitoxin system death-on-curing family toxin [Hyphobacterium sp. SN044]MCF8879355.1 type II toxin-antitoxin system death-on-curing family toxin [Hyphobacterium sp. SN044]
MSRKYLTIAEVLTIHSDQIEAWGGDHSLRDAGQLESALYRPQSGYYDDLIAEAAALWESLSQNHPFVDGNKRTAFAATLVFLDINGIQVTAEPADVLAWLEPLYQRHGLSFDEIDTWLRANTVSR